MSFLYSDAIFSFRLLGIPDQIFTFFAQRSSAEDMQNEEGALDGGVGGGNFGSDKLPNDSMMLLRSLLSEDCSRAAICEASNSLNCKNSGRFTDPVQEYMAMMYDAGRRGRDRGRGESTISLGLPRRLYFSADTPPGCCSCTPHLSITVWEKGFNWQKGSHTQGRKREEKREKLLSARFLGRCAVRVRVNTSYTCKGQNVALLVSGFVAWIYISSRRLFFFLGRVSNRLHATSKIKDVVVLVY